MISNDYVNKILNLMTGNSSASSIYRPTEVYLGLCMTAPNSSTGAVSDEPTSKKGYERKLVGGSSSNTQYFGAASGGIITNNTEIQFKTAREAWNMSDDDPKLYYWFLSESDDGPATIWGEIKDMDDNSGITITTATVPTFYEDELQASIDVPLS